MNRMIDHCQREPNFVEQLEQLERLKPPKRKLPMRPAAAATLESRSASDSEAVNEESLSSLLNIVKHCLIGSVINSLFNNEDHRMIVRFGGGSFIKRFSLKSND